MSGLRDGYLRARNASAMTVPVSIPSPLYSYTGNQREVSAIGETIGEVMRDLDRQFPGLRFRIITEQDTVRPHIKLYVNEELVNRLDAKLAPGDRVHIITALSGG